MDINEHRPRVAGQSWLASILDISLRKRMLSARKRRAVGRGWAVGGRNELGKHNTHKTERGIEIETSRYREKGHQERNRGSQRGGQQICDVSSLLSLKLLCGTSPRCFSDQGQALFTRTLGLPGGSMTQGAAFVTEHRSLTTAIFRANENDRRVVDGRSDGLMGARKNTDKGPERTVLHWIISRGRRRGNLKLEKNLRVEWAAASLLALGLDHNPHDTPTPSHDSVPARPPARPPSSSTPSLLLLLLALSPLPWSGPR